MKIDSTVYGCNAPAVERNDCSVRALSVAACISYATAHEVFARHGRLNRRKTPWLVTYRVIKELFPTVSLRQVSTIVTLKRFTELHPAGHYIVHVRGHALAVCDGVVHDWSLRERRRVRSYYQLT